MRNDATDGKKKEKEQKTVLILTQSSTLWSACSGEFMIKLHDTDVDVEKKGRKDGIEI